MSEARVIARKDPSNLIVSTGPDVHLTPVGASMQPVAYTTIGNLGDAVRVSTTDLDNDCPEFQLNSRVPNTTGHEPGTGKGIIDSGYLQHAHADVASDYTFSEGFATVAHRDPAWVTRPGLGPTEPRQGMGDD